MEKIPDKKAVFHLEEENDKEPVGDNLPRPGFFAGRMSDLRKMALENPYFRRVIETTNEMQIVLMSIQVGRSIPKESHPKSTQFIMVQEGDIGVRVNGVNRAGSTGGFHVIPSSHVHKVWNDSHYMTLKLIVIYAPPVHPRDLVEKENPSPDRGPF